MSLIIPLPVGPIDSLKEDSSGLHGGTPPVCPGFPHPAKKLKSRGPPALLATYLDALKGYAKQLRYPVVPYYDSFPSGWGDEEEGRVTI